MDRRKFFGATAIGATSIALGAQENNVIESAQFKSEKVFESVSDMKLSDSLSVGDIVTTLGYYLPGDGGHAQYEISSSENDLNFPNGANILLPAINGVARLLFSNQINIKQFGAKGDEQDDTQYIQEAIDFASANNLGVIDAPGIYQINSLRVYNGIRFLKLTHGTIKGSGVANKGVIELTGPNKFDTQAVRNAVISVRVDMSNGDHTAIYGDGTSDCIIEKCRIYGFTDLPNLNHYGIIIYAGSRNIIRDNNIVGHTDPTQRGLLIDLIGESSAFGGFYTGVSSLPDNPCRHNIITNNILISGSYAINLLGSLENIVSDNICQGQNHRSIYLASSSYKNQITSNQCLEFLSSGVLIGYGSCENTISDNNCVRKGNWDGGEAAINVNTGSKDNLITNNYIDAQVNYGIYIATDSDGNTVNGNDISSFRLAGIALENDWVDSPPNFAIYSRPNYGSPIEGDQWSLSDLVGNTITSNKINDASFSNACGIYIAQISSGGLTGTRNNIIEGNITSNGKNLRYALYIYAQADNMFSGLTVSNNIFGDGEQLFGSFSPLGASSWNDKISYFANNKELDKLILDEARIFPNNETTPSVKTNTQAQVATKFTCANDTTTIVNFLDGYDGQNIVVRLNNKTKIAHNPSFIRPKSLNDIVGSSSNQLVGFTRMEGVWFETFRNF